MAESSPPEKWYRRLFSYKAMLLFCVAFVIALVAEIYLLSDVAVLRSPSLEVPPTLRIPAEIPIHRVATTSRSREAVRKRMTVPAFDFGDSQTPRFPVWYATNRLLNVALGGHGYTDERGPQVHYGIAHVEIPLSHEFGSVGSSTWIYREVLFEDDHVKLRTIQRLDKPTFFRMLGDEVIGREKEDRTVLLFIHGYNNSFEDAAVRAAQIGHDLKVPGVTTMFDWASKGSELAYASDKASIEASEEQLRSFVEEVASWSHADTIHVIAHSMGNYGFARAIQSLASTPQGSRRVQLGKIILAAADVDVELFRRLAIAYPLISTKTTMYISSKDLALRGSGFLHDYPRAGFYPPITIIPKIDTIAVSNVDLTLLGHGYLADAAPVLQDMATFLWTELPAARRARLQERRDSAGTYWEIGR